MPVVRLRRSVSSAPLPGVMRQAAETPQSEGAGVAAEQARTAVAGARLFSDLSTLSTRAVLEIRQREEERANAYVDVDTTNQLTKARQDLLFGDGGFITLQGDQVKDSLAPARAKWDQKVATIGAGAKTDAQKLRYAQRSAAETESFAADADRHYLTEMQKAESQQVDAGIALALGDAETHALDPAAVKTSQDKAIALMTDYATRHGVPAETVAQQTQQLTSKFQSTAIYRLLQLGKTMEARVNFEAVKDQIVGGDRDKIETAVHNGTVLGEAQRVADDIAIPGPENDSLSDWIDKLKARNLDPEVREKAMQLLRETDADRQRDQRESEQRDSVAMANYIDRGGGTVAGLQLRPEWQRADPSTRSSLMAYLDHKIRGVPVQTELRLWSVLADMVRDDPQQFVKEDLTPYIGRLSEGDYQGFKRMQIEVVAGGERAAAVVRSVSLDSDLFNTVAQSAGINAYPDPTNKLEKERVDTLQYNVKQAIGHAQGVKGKELTYDEKRGVMEQVLDQHVSLNVWGTDPDVPAAAVVSSERESAYVPIAKVPRINLQEFTNYIRSVSPVSAKWDEATIQKTYRTRIERAYAALVLRMSDDEVKRRLEGR